MAAKPYTWSRKPTAARRSYRALKDSARDRAEILRRRAAMKLRGHKHMCRECGRTFRTENGRDAHWLQHKRDKARAKTRNTSQAKVPHRGDQFTDLSTGKKFRNHLDFNDHERQRAEKEDTARKRAAERARRAKAVNDRNTRGGQPNGAPKTRNGRTPDGRTSAERKAEWHAHRKQHAAGRLDRAGNRIPHEPSPRVVRPRTPTPPKVRT